MSADDASELLAALQSRERSAEDAVADSLARIEAVDGEIVAFASTDPEGALRRARELDARGPRAHEPLFGLPIALKSNVCVRGMESNCGSRILAGYRAPYTATFAQRLFDAGAVCVGMTHMDEFAMGSSGENSAFGVPRNPWDRERVPGGSSSGSAAAVAAGLVPVAMGSDTGGSVRQPAAMCGVSGFKPTYGRVSRYGLIAFGSSLDQPSPLARSARDLERVMEVISGADPLDATSIAEPALRADPRSSLEGLRVGVADELFPDAVDAGVRAVVRAAVERFAALGAEVVDVSLPFVRHAVPTYYVVATAEASSNLARYDGVRYGMRREGDGSLQGMFAATREAGFGDEVKRRILLGTYVLSSGYYDAWYARALRVRGRIAREFGAAFEEVDLLLSPTAPTPAFARGELAGDPLSMYLADVLTAPASLAGLPAASVPCGLAPAPSAETEVELPVGLQIAGPVGGDARVLAAARLFQEATEHHRSRPPLWAGGTA